LIERLKGHGDSVYSVSFTRDGRFLVSASLDKGVRVWDVGHLGIVPAPGSPQQLEEAGMSVVPPSPTRRRSLKTRCVTQFVGHRDFVLSVAVSHDGKWVVSGSKDRGVMWWELGAAGETGGDENGGEREGLGGGKDREAVCVLQGHKNSVISIDLSPVGNMLATGSGDWQARICEWFWFFI
jgi:glucose repression regulatory protein TUP1